MSEEPKWCEREQGDGDPYIMARSWSPCRGMASLNISPRPKKRATSLKKPRRRFLENVELEEMRPRTSSLPTRNSLKKPSMQYLSPFADSIPDDDVYTLRTFVTTSKGLLVNRGDSLRSRSTNSIVSSGSGSITELTPLSRTSSSLSQSSIANSTGSTFGANAFRVLVLGSPSVGKTSITRQFMTSEYLGGFDASMDLERERTVSVLLDGEESNIDIMDPSEDMLQYWRSVPTVDAYVLVFSIDDRITFERCTDVLYEIRKQEKMDTALILVANKCDLVRTRGVTTEEAKSVATTYDCKYIETSVVLNHNVDELLVGILSQIRLKRKVAGARRDAEEDKGCYSRSKMLLTKLFKKDQISKSCEKLYVL